MGEERGASGWRSDRPEAAQRLDASEQIADRQHHIGDDGDPEAVLGDERNCREFANHGQKRQNHAIR